jgi:hypothetical protein
MVLSNSDWADGEPAVDLSSERVTRAVAREFGRFRSNLIQTGYDEDWLQAQVASYAATAQRQILALLLNGGLILDHQRQSLPLDAANVAGSLREAFRQDLAQLLNLWTTTRGTNHVKIVRDIVRSYREEEDAAPYADVPGLCKVATVAEVEAQGWSLNPGRYVGVADRPADDFDFKERLEELNEELERLNAEAHELEARIAENVASLLESTP